LGAKRELAGLVVVADLIDEKIDGTLSFGANNEGVSCAGFETLIWV
jgi:hypothetical protein